MSEARVERILTELTARYGNDARFGDRLRPLLHRILAPGLDEGARVALLECAAETCARDRTIRTNCRVAREHWQAWFERMRTHLRELTDVARARASEARRRRSSGERPRADDSHGSSDTDAPDA